MANSSSIWGCPEETIRDIISADLKKLYSARRWQLIGPISSTVRFWQTNYSITAGEQHFRQLQTMESEYLSVFKELLNSDAPISRDFITDVSRSEMRLLMEFGPRHPKTQGRYASTKLRLMASKRLPGKAVVEDETPAALGSRTVRGSFDAAVAAEAIAKTC